MHEERCTPFHGTRCHVKCKRIVRGSVIQVRNMIVLAFYIQADITTFTTKHEVCCCIRITRYETHVYTQDIPWRVVYPYPIFYT